MKNVITYLKKELPLEEYIKEHEGYFTTNAIRNLVVKSELEELVELFFEIINIEKARGYEGLDKLTDTIIAEFSDDITLEQKKEYFSVFSKIEQILKHFISILYPDYWQETEDNKDVNLMLMACLRKLKLIPKQYFELKNRERTLKKLYENKPSDQLYLEEILEVYFWRNIATHEAPELENWRLLRLEVCLWFIYLYIVKKNKEQFLEVVEEKNKEVFERREYCENEIKNHKNNNFVYYDFQWKNIENKELMVIDKTFLLPNNFCLLFGEAGSGKSVALSRLFCTAAEKHIVNPKSPIPVFIELKELNRSKQKGIIDEVAEVLKITLDECEHLLSAGHIMLFLDGLNEITKYEDMVPVKCQSLYKAQIKVINELYPKTKIWLTDRQLTNFGEALNDNDKNVKMELQKIDRKDVYAFYKSNYPESELLSLGKLDEQISDQMLFFINTPLKLKMFCELTFDKKEPPKEPLELVGKYLKRIIEREYEEKATLNITSIHVFWEILIKLSEEAGFENNPIDSRKARGVVKEVLLSEGNSIGAADDCIKIASELKIIQDDSNYITFPYVDWHNYLWLETIS